MPNYGICRMVLADGIVNRLTMKQALSVPQKLTLRPAARRVLAESLRTANDRLMMKQALSVPQKLTLRPTARVLADGGVNRLTMKQALSVPQSSHFAPPQGGPAARRVLADGIVNRLTMKQALSVPQAHTMPHRKVAPPQGAPHI